MNKRNINKLIKHLRTMNNGPDSEMGLDMTAGLGASEHSDHPCGAACCIGGHCEILFGEIGGYEDAIRNYLGVSVLDAFSIGDPPEDHPAWSATPGQAADMLEHFRDTGVVDWDRAMGVEAAG